MPFRFRRSVKILPSVGVNVGKRGASLSIGAKGAHVTMRPGHEPRTTLSVPGTGVSFTTGGQTAAKAREPHHGAPGPAQTSMPAEPIRDEPLPQGVAWRGWLWIAIGVLIVAAVVMRLAR